MENDWEEDSRAGSVSSNFDREVEKVSSEE